VELHGGRISAESAGDGRGSTFTVVLPTSRRPSASQPPRRSTPQKLGAAQSAERSDQLRGLRVLVVDDDDDSRELVAAVLEESGCATTTAHDVESAMHAIDAAIPDVLLSDIGMPGEDGYDLIRKVRALSRARGGETPAAALTAYARPEDRRKMLGAGYSMHLPKPVDPDELVAVVAALSRLKHAT
jgi:CheY-like chemotaxis protein